LEEEEYSDDKCVCSAGAVSKADARPAT
jgi:hypothetical protein